jgi:chromosome segregation ATPase
MTPWLALSLGLWLGQTPDVTPSLSRGFGGSETEDATAATQAEEPAATSGNPPNSSDKTRQEVEGLRAQIKELQAQLEAQHEEDSAKTQVIQQQLSGMRERAEELERMRQQRLADLERAEDAILAVDQALETGESDVGDALSEADSALEQVVQSASEAGVGWTVALIQDARGGLARARDAVANRDTYHAQWHLVYAALRLHDARLQNLDEPSATVIQR